MMVVVVVKNMVDHHDDPDGADGHDEEQGGYHDDRGDGDEEEHGGQHQHDDGERRQKYICPPRSALYHNIADPNYHDGAKNMVLNISWGGWGVVGRSVDLHFQRCRTQFTFDRQYVIVSSQFKSEA